MAKPKSGGLLAILGPPKGAEEGEEGEEGMGGDIETAAMEDFLSAIQAKDPAAMKDAFKRAYDACAAKSEGEAGEEY